MEINQNYSAADLKVMLNNNEIRAEGYHLEKFDLSFKENEHTKLVIGFEIKENYKNDWSIYNRETVTGDLGNNTTFAVALRERKYFSGIVQEIVIHEREAGDIYIELLVYSKSELLDRTKIYRVYQNPEIRYIDIVKSIVGRYNGSITIVGINLGKESEEEESADGLLYKKIRKGLIIQYYETDWEFLVRIVSHLGMGVFNTENGGITIGFPQEIPKEWNSRNGNAGKGVNRENNIFYYLTSTDYFTLGDNIVENMQKDMGFVTEGAIGYSSEKFYGRYSTKPADYVYEYIANENIKGCVIEGSVTAVPNSGKGKIAVMTVDFYSGLLKAAGNKIQNRRKVVSEGDWVFFKDSDKRFIFPYTTPYSQTNTGYFCTPEVFDTVAVNFPTTEEHEGYVVWAVNNEGNLRFSNPYIRNYTTREERGSESVCYDFRLNKNSWLVECAEQVTEIFTDKIVESRNNIIVNSDNNIVVENKNEVSLLTKKYIVNVNDTYEENVRDRKSGEYGELTEDINSARKVRCELYDVTTGAYKVKQ